MMGVEQAQLLADVHGVEGVVDVEHDAARHLVKALAIMVHPGAAHAQQGVPVRAAELVPAGHATEAIGYREPQVDALYREGDEHGNNAALSSAIQTSLDEVIDQALLDVSEVTSASGCAGLTRLPQDPSHARRRKTKMQINLLFDSLAQAAPQYFKDALQKAASLLGATFTNNISVNVEIGYGEYPGNNQPESSGSASAAPSTGVYDSYNYVRSYLANNAASEVSSGVSALPQSSTIQGQSQVAVWRAQEKLMGQVSAYDTGLDGYAGFATDIPEASLEGVAIHELTHAMGRVNYGPQPDVLDLYRFSSPGTRLFAGGSPNSASYFSLDGGRTDLADYGQSSDPSDFLNSSGKTPNDPFNEYYNGSTIQGLTSIDNLEMEALGYTTHANFLVTDATTGISSQSAGGTYVGPVSGISTEYISVTSDNLAVAAQVPDVFIHTGAGNDAIQVLSGRNVIDGGGGSNFMVAGTGQDTFLSTTATRPPTSGARWWVRTAATTSRCSGSLKPTSPSTSSTARVPPARPG